MSSKIVKCTCTHKIQDELYGIGNRVANELRNGQYRCSVCESIVGSSQTVQTPKIKEVKELEKEVKKSSDKTSSIATKSKKDEKSKKSSLKGGKR